MQMELEAPSSVQILHGLVLDIYKDISSDDSTTCNKGLERSIRLFNSCETGLVIESAMKTDFLARLVYLIQSHQFTMSTDPLSRAVIVNSLKNIANMVSGSPETTKHVMSCEMMQLVVGILGSPDFKFKNEAVFILANAAAECSEIRDMLVSANVLPFLVEIFQTEMTTGFVNEDLGTNALWAFKNFYHSEPALSLDIASPMLNLIFQLYSITSPITQNHIPACIEAISFMRVVIADNPTTVFGDLMFVFVKAVPLDPTKILSIIGDLILENDEYALKFVQHGGLQMAISALDSIHDMSVRKEIFWILGNSCSASEMVSRQIIEVGLVPYAITSLSGPQPIANEAGWVIVETVRLCLHMPTLAADFLNAGVVQGIYNLLCLALSPIGMLTDNTFLLIIQSLGAIHTLFTCEPERLRCALSSVVPREDIDFTITVDELFSSLMSVGNPIIANNASVLYQALNSSQ